MSNDKTNGGEPTPAPPGSLRGSVFRREARDQPERVRGLIAKHCSNRDDVERAASELSQR